MATPDDGSQLTSSQRNDRAERDAQEVMQIVR
jgi:hypothetical protein